MIAPISNEPSASKEAEAPLKIHTEPPARPVTARSFWIGLIAALSFCSLTPYNDYFIAATYLAGNFFPISGMLAICLLVLLVNPFLIAIGKRSKIFTSAEIITIWAMIIVVAGIPSSGLMRYLIPHIVALPFLGGQDINAYKEVTSHLPQNLFVTDHDAVQGFFKGIKRGAQIPWGAWIKPLTLWSGFVALLFTGYFSMSALLRRQWVENERFAFPLVRLPTLLAEEPEPGQKFNSLVRSPLLWFGVLLVTILHTLKGLHLFHPAVPDVQTTYYLFSYIPDGIWRAIWVNMAVYPLVIGFAYLLSSDVCLSLWLFYIVFYLQNVIATQNAWDVSPVGAGIATSAAFTVYQEVGAFVALTAYTLYSMKSHLMLIWDKVTDPDSTVDDTREPMSYKIAFYGVCVSFLGMYFWMTQIAMVQPAMAFGVLVGAFCVFITLSWLVAQSGLLFAQEAFSPAQVTTLFTGSNAFSATTLGMVSVVEHVGWLDAREFMMPPLLNAFKVTSDTRLDARSLTKALAVCVVLVVIVSAGVSIWLPYTHGGASSMTNTWMYNDAPNIVITWTQKLLHNPYGINTSAMVSMLEGAAVIFAIFVLRSFIPSFSLHPAGFLVAATYPMSMLWFSFLIGWLLKTPIMHYGGMKGYRAMLPFFLGLILGDCLNAIIWVIVGLVTHTGYMLLPT